MTFELHQSERMLLHLRTVGRLVTYGLVQEQKLWYHSLAACGESTSDSYRVMDQNQNPKQIMILTVELYKADVLLSGINQSVHIVTTLCCCISSSETDRYLQPLPL